MSVNKGKIPFSQGMWVTKSSGEARLLGSRCLSCKELFFPRKVSGICVHCQQRRELEDVELGPFGKIVSFTEVMQPPAGGHYHGPVPYCYGLIDLNDGVRVEAQLGGDFEKLKVGMKVNLVIEPLYVDSEGNEVQVFRFHPIEEGIIQGGSHEN